ncbi:MAG TPA: TOBE domain-containing protein [Roseiarcus sp.]|nr:TOBE domain-containing protein [Roseiarcus sp.]
MPQPIAELEKPDAPPEVTRMRAYELMATPLDEPLSNLDAELRVQMRGEIRELHRRLGTTCIYVTHDQIEAMTMADRIVVMHDGVVEQAGAPLELYDRPANLFVASFLGSPAMNFIAGRLIADGAFVSEDGSGAVSPRKAPARSGAQVICGFRPEAVVVDANSPLRLRVTLTEPTGAETHVFGRVGGVDVKAVLPERITFSEGSDIGISIPADQLHIFEAASKTRLN